MALSLVLAVLASFVWQGDRGSVLGMVRDREGRPWRDADVVLLAPRNDVNAADDLVRVKSDDRGRFRAKVRVGFLYSAWALTAQVDGTYRASAIVHPVGVASRVQLVEASAPRQRTRVRFRGLDAWAAHAPLRLTVQDAGQHTREQALELDAEGYVLLPPLPADKAAVRVHGKDGLRIVAGSYPSAGYVDLRKQSHEIKLPDACVFALRVTARRTRRPIEGARVWQSPRVLLGRTNGNGIAYLTVPSGNELSSFRILTDGPDHGESSNHLGFLRVPAGRTMQELKASKKVDIKQELWPGSTLRGRLLTVERKPLAGVELRFHSRIRVGHATSPTGPREYETGKQGEFVIASSQDLAFRLAARLRPEHLARLPRSETYPLAATAILADSGDGRSPKLGDLRLDELLAIDIQVLHDDGEPAENPWIFIADPKRHESKAVPNAIVLRGDRRGRLRVLTVKTDQLSIGAVARGGVREVDVRWPREDSGRALSLAIRLRPTIVVSGRAVDQDGEPVGNARVTADVTRERDARDVFLSWWMAIPRATTDANGAFALTVSRDYAYELRAAPPPTGKGFTQAGVAAIGVASEAIRDVEISIPFTQGAKRKN